MAEATSSNTAKKYPVNLPVTAFAMKANLTRREPQFQARWDAMDLYGKIRARRAGAERRVLHDGPPYANGDIHMGHLLNKVLKDFVARSLNLRGFDSPYVPGWDCHGLPIEHKVMKDLGAKAQTLAQSDVRKFCHAEAMKWVGIQSTQFRRLGVMGDWDNPYLTLDPRYEAGIMDVLADLVEKGLVFRQLKPIHWDIADRTALAEAELEYHDHTSPSVYVNFAMEAGVPEPFGPGPWHAMIWTTTPWTLPANVAIAVHPNLDYAGVRYRDPKSGREIGTVMAAELVGRVMGLRGVVDYEEVGRVKGSALEGARYRHPFIDRTGTVVLADYVTVEDGTGLVHTAPGHGAEDYRTGLAYGLPVLSPVDAAGRFVADDAGVPAEWVGTRVFDANPRIIERLESDGSLYHTFTFQHSYPHGWRSKKPVIFRATAQWFVGVDRGEPSLRARTLEAIKKVEWMPSWGQARIEAMVGNRPDWCISRQRAWGVPIPVLYDEATGYEHLTAESVRHFRDLFRREGADAWFSKDVADLVPPDLDTTAHPVEHLRKGTDILDVWFESGSSHRSVIREESYGIGPYPAYMYLEGSDQHRGWFQSSILTAVGTTGHAPFQTVLTHGFVVDEKGQKISKSLGNYVGAVEMTNQHGADVLRLYVASMDYADDVRVSERGIKEAAEAYRKIRNTFRYILGNLQDYRDLASPPLDLAVLPYEQRWLLDQLFLLVSDVTASYEAFEFYKVYQRLYQFCSVELSALYFDFEKDHLYASSRSAPDLVSSKVLLTILHQTVAKLFAPILPHTCEEVWDFVPGNSPGKAESVHLTEWPQVDPSWEDPAIRSLFQNFLDLRSSLYVEIERRRRSGAIGSSQAACVKAFVASEDLFLLLQEKRDLFEKLSIISELQLFHAPDLDHVYEHPEWGGREQQDGTRDLERHIIWRVDPSTFSKCQRCWNYRESVGRDAGYPDLCERCATLAHEFRW